MYKESKKLISFLLAITFLVNIFIPIKSFASGELEFTAIFDNDSKILEIASTSQNAQEFFNDVKDIKINENLLSKDSNEFTVETGKIKVADFNATLFKVNNITLASNSFGNKSFVFNYPDGALISEGVEIISVGVAQEGQSNIVDGQEMGAVYEAIRIFFEQQYSESYYELGKKIKGVRIDGRDYPMRSVERGMDLPVFIMFERAFRAYYNSPIGKIAIDDFKLRDKHEIVVTFIDDSTVVYKDEGYVAPDRSGETNVFPGQQGENENPTGVAAKYEIDRVLVEESYGSKELRIYPKATEGKLDEFDNADVRRITKIKINRVDLGLPDTLRRHYSGAIIISNDEVIQAAEMKNPIGLEIFFDDDSKLSKDISNSPNAPKPRRELVPTAKAFLLNAGKTELSKADNVFTRDVKINALDEKIGLWDGAEIIVEFKPMTVQGIVAKVTKVEYETMGGSKSTAQRVLGEDGKFKIRVPEFIIKDANSVEDTELVLHLTTSVGHMGAQKVVMLIDWNRDYIPPTPQQPQEPSNPGVNPPENGGTPNPPAVNGKDIKVKVVKIDDESQPSMMNRAINPNAKLVEKNGKFEYTIQLKPISMGGGVGISVDRLSIFKGEQKEVLSKTTVEGEYPEQYTFTLDSKVEKLKVAIMVQAMGNSDINAMLVFDYGETGDNGTTPNPPDSNGNDSNEPKLGDKYKIKDVALNSYDELKIGTEPHMNYTDISKVSKLIVNGVDVGKPETLRLSRVDDKLAISNIGEDAKAIAEAKKKSPISIIILFEDGSKVEFNTNVPQTDNQATPGDLNITSDLPDGEYTLTYKAYKKGTEQKELSTINSFFDPKVKLVVENGIKKVTFLNHSFAGLMLDFAIRKSDMKQLGGENQLYKTIEKKVVEKDKNDVAKKVEYSVALNNLEGVKEFAVLGSGPMGGNISEIGDYTNSNYKMLEVLFDNSVIRGWNDFKVNEDNKTDKEQAIQILTDALIAAGVEDKNNDGVLSKEELMNAKGKDKKLADIPLTNVLDLENNNITDISILKDLGPNIKAVNLNGNKITELPSNVFDNATGITHLFLGANNIEKIDKTAFQNLTNLKLLDMEGNKLPQLPEELFKNNTKLETLDLNNIGLESVPSDLLKTLRKLDALYLYQNKLTSLPEDFFSGQGIRFKTLHINHNKLTNLPASLSNAKDLQTLNARNNELTSVPDSYKNFKNLKGLDLSNNNLISVPTELLTNMIKHSRNAYMVGVDLTNNNIQSLPLDEMITALNSGGKKLSKFEINLNELSLTPSEDEIENYKKLGVLFDNAHEVYFPQKGFVGAEIVAEKGKINLTQKFDILEMYYWNEGDSTYYGGKNVFRNSDEFESYLTKEGRDFNSISRDLDRAEGVKAILDKKGANWQIQTTITKEGQIIYNKLSDLNSAEGLNQVFDDANMKTGDKYKMSKVLYVKNIFGMSKALSYEKSFVALSGATNTLNPNNPTPPGGGSGGNASLITHRVPVWLKNKNTNDKSMGNSALVQVSEVVENNGRYSYKITFKPISITQGGQTLNGEITNFAIEENGVMRDISGSRTSSGIEYQFESNSKIFNKLVSIRVDIMEQLGMPDQEAILVFDWNGNNPAPNTNPQPSIPNAGGGAGGGTTGVANTPEVLENRAKQVMDEKHYYNASTLQKIEKAQQDLKANVEGAKEKLEQALAEARVEKIEKVFAKGYVKPNAKNEFRPNAKMTRGELAELFADAINKIDTTDVKFKDVKENEAFSKGVQVLAQNGLITGYGDGSFKPEGEITRAEFAVMIAKILNLAPAKKDIKDVSANHWAYGYLAAIMEKGIIKGYENGEVRPNGNITRAEAIVMLNRAFEVKSQEEKKVQLSDVNNSHWAYESIVASVKK